jgi:7,8-dihydroneopterin aldolase/epimerase/oxygenase
MDTLHIRNLRVESKHHSHCDELGDRLFEINITMEVDITKAVMSDDIFDTVDWTVVRQNILAIIEDQPCGLVETLTQCVALKILENPKVRSVEVEASKPDKWENGRPGVTIRRSNIM